MTRARYGARSGALLVFIWGASGIWSAGHVLAHHDDRESGHHLERTAESPDRALVPAHGHGHAHDELLPAASMGKAPKLGAPPLLSETPDIVQPDASLAWFMRIVPARASVAAAAAQRPRAPPIV